jgi:SAM-dependent methyltransferase
MQTAVERWKEIIDARASQMDAAYARLGRTSADFWDRRARRFYTTTRESAASDPLYRRLQREVTAETTVLDVGAGTGRFALALAPKARHVIAVEPNTSMLNYLRQEAVARGIGNVTSYQTTWQDAPDDLSADIVVCSHVLYPIRDIVPFLEKLRASTRLACYIYLRALSLDAITAPLWRHFHGKERRLPPGYIHALDVLYEMDIYANVEVVKLPLFMAYASLEEAVEEQMEQLILPDNEKTRRELRALLADWLVERDGMLRPPQREMAAAMIWFPAETDA